MNWISTLCLIHLAFLGIANAASIQVAYEDELKSFILKEAVYTAGNGTISIEPASVGNSKRGVYDAYFKDFSFYSYDSFHKLQKLQTLLGKAESLDATGDRLFLYNYIAFNAQDKMVELSYTADFKDEVCDFLAFNNLNDTSLLAASSRNSELSLFYKNFPIEVCSKATVLKRDSTGCDDRHAPNTGDCQNLVNDLENNHRGDVYQEPRSYCIGKCCISWSLTYPLNGDFLSGKAGWCINQCVRGGLSCEIFGVAYANTSLDICLSNRANGCT
ncbi:uncharacterized protein RJT20DRAFT_136829 [Scheffersomyces xylosifermentans]